MPVKHQSINETHVFWLFNWGYHRVHSSLRLVPIYQRCDITSDSLTIHDEAATVVITLTDITSYDIQRFYEGAGGGHTSNLKLSLLRGVTRDGKRRREAKELFLATADVFSHYMDDNWELKNMYEVVRCRKNGEVPMVDPNPYHRVLRRRGQSERVTERVWDPYLHPSHYGHVPTVMGILITRVLGVIGVSLLGCIIIGLIYYIVTTFF